MKHIRLQNTFTQRVLGKALFGAAMLACGLLPLLAGGAPRAAPERTSMELPATWHGQPVRPLALSSVEQRFAERFPGQIARLTDGRQIVVLRQIERPTRMLHPATDCYRALGWRITAERLETFDDGNGAPGRRRCFVATRAGTSLRVCEHIVDGHGQTYSDTSAWYWDAALGRSHGAWRAITVTEPLGLQGAVRSAGAAGAASAGGG